MICTVSRRSRSFGLLYKHKTATVLYCRNLLDCTIYRYIYSSELPSRVTWLLLLQGREGPKAVRKILLVPCDHPHRLGKHKGETSHDNVSTSHRARRQLGTSTVLRTTH